MPTEGDIDRPATWALRLLTITAILGTAGALSYSGFCFTEFRWLSADDFIDAAIEDVMRGGMHIIETPTGGYVTFAPKQNEVRYVGRDEFRRLNPNCCKIVPHDPVWISFRHRLFGRAAKSVLIRYTVNYINEYGTVSRMDAVAQRAISNCGHALNTGH